MHADLTRCLDDLEERIDEAVEAELLDKWRRFVALDWPEPIFTPRRPAPNPPRTEWPAVSLNRTLDDFDAMAIQQLGSCSGALAGAGGQLMMVRANYGTPILPTLFGCELFIMPEDTQTLPACHPLPGGVEEIRRVVERGVPPLEHPYLQKVFAMGRRYQQIRRQYPKIGRWVLAYHPDLQGPMDVVEMIWGSEVFIALYDEPQLVHALLKLVTDTYERVLHAWQEIAPPLPGDAAPHWGMLHGGRIMLRDDSAMNLAPEQFAEFVAPYDRRLLETFGGGAMHACGRVEHFLGQAVRLPGLRAFNMSQPELNDMSVVWPETIERGIVLIGLNRGAADAALAAGVDLRGRVHCW